MNASAYNAAICAASSIASGATGYVITHGGEAAFAIAGLASAFGILSAMANAKW